MTKGILNIHLFFSPIENESRLMKETNSLIKLNLVDEVVIIGKGEKGLLNIQKIDENRKIIRVNLLKQNAQYGSIKRKVVALIRILQYLFGSLKYIIVNKPQFISCHNLMLLPISVMAKFISGAKLIYVPHELETQRTGITGINKKLAILNERFFIRFVYKIMVVCEPIATWYQNAYKISKVYILPNVPINPYLQDKLEKKNFFREEFNIGVDDLIFIYQGVIDEARGCADLIECFKTVAPNKHLVLMGYGQLADYVDKVSKLTSNIHFKPAVPSNEIIDFTSSAEVGIFFLPFSIGQSYIYSLPNKFYEYLIAGLPIIVSKNLEYIGQKIESNDLGWVCPSNNTDFIKKINEIDKNKIQRKIENIRKYTSELGWQNEEKILLEVYS